MKTKLITIRKIIASSVKKLKKAGLYFGHGTDNPYDEAVNIVLRTLSLTFESDKSILNKTLTAAEQAKIEDLIAARIKKRIPAAYLLNEAWFFGLQFYVDERVMIPRSSMAELIGQKFSPWIAENEVHNILDLGTGSGCIAIACAKAFPKAKIDAVDISPDALAVAETNIRKHCLKKRINLLNGDLFAPIGNKKYDIIVSNPPYVSKKEMRTLPKEYSHEPKLAFYGGKNKGLDLVIKIIRGAKKHLTAKAILVVEAGNNCEILPKMFPKIPFIWPDFEYGEGGIFILPIDVLDK